MPSEANRIATVTTTGFSDPVPGADCKLSAVDVHGNESGHALTSGTTGAGGSYWVQLEAEGRRLVRRLVALR